MNRQPETIRTAALGMLISTLLLTGCGSQQLTPQAILDQGADGSQAGAISITELLNNARHQAGTDTDSQVPAQLTLTFSPQQMELSEQQAIRLNAYANQYHRKAVQLKCAPSAASDSFTAMAQGMNRCIRVSRFFDRRALKAEVHMQPQMTHNQILVAQ
ncbi:hypothetical protein [Aliamphritea hakodatensis]|uniref:hypothetical protein n=1 Tax=Aliamphritea hakodatensis TaxID=2895352 RepID=UPI0022FD5166|nr:hypothetical protein [Aliamphritea hakodatensis]